MSREKGVPQMVKSVTMESTDSRQSDDIPPVERTLTCQSRIVSPTEFMFDWILKVVAVLSAILFGIWAPVSYRLQDSGNKSSDEAQDRLVQKMDKMGQEIEGLKAQMNSLAVLRGMGVLRR